MRAAAPLALLLNGGSSSIRFAVYGPGAAAGSSRCLLRGELSRIGLAGAQLTAQAQAEPPTTCPVAAPGYAAAVQVLLAWLAGQPVLAAVQVVGHRVVHGMEHQAPELVTPALLAELHRISCYDPAHLPGEILLMEACRQQYPHLPQVACFDTAFHHNLPRVAQLLAIPRRFTDQGIRRYGFHGLSFSYLLEELGRVAGPAAAQGRVLLAHLGGGASLAAVRGGRCLDTSMGFTPAGGLVMGTRPGDLDPGVAAYLMQAKNLTARQFNQLINKESGLLGVSETSSDLRDLLARQATDERAAEAVELFCYQARKWMGAFAAVLDGLDTLVFAGGIGEHAAEVRGRICQGLGFLGVALDADRNAAHAAIISSAASRVCVRVMPTDETGMMARLVGQLWATHLSPSTIT